MRAYKINVESVSEVQFDVIAEQFAEMMSDYQAVFLEEMFDALKFGCKDHFKFESQLLFIAKDIKKRNLKNLVYVVETLNEFLKEDDGGKNET